MPSSEKANLQAHINNQTRDLPPAYENTLVPNLNSNNPHPTTAITSSHSTRASTTTTNNHHQSQPNINIPSQNPLKTLSRLSVLNLSAYGVRDAKLSDDHTTLTTSKPELTSTQYALTKFIHDQAALPPKPVMIIRGTHSSYGSSGGAAVDFELKLNLMGMLDVDTAPDFDGTGRSRIRVKAFQPNATSSSSQQTCAKRLSEHRTSSDEPNPLDAWIRKFTQDDKAKADNRTFTLSRVTLNLPCAILEGHVRTLIAATKYRGKVTVEFPCCTVK